MKRIVTTGLTLTVIVLLAACSSKEEKGSLSEKKTQLADLQKEQQAISDKIKTLEEAIQKMDTTANFGLTKQVVVTPLVLQNFSHYIDLQGKIDAQDISYVSPRGMGGQVRSLLVKQGDRVRKGQLLLKLDDAIARQGLASAQQGAESVKTQLALAKNLYQRQKNLYDQGIGAEVQLLNSKNNVDALENQLKQANEGIKMAQVPAA
ncbi:MAG: biotin/lipoyl-binding protein [Chitinophagaceae bacterium]|nr:biotin/lipoyl-binding protein [Chitinophagaceae bacterium]